MKNFWIIGFFFKNRLQWEFEVGKIIRKTAVWGYVFIYVEIIINYLLRTRYKPEGLWIDSRWWHWNFCWHNPCGHIMAVRLTQPLTDPRFKNKSAHKCGKVVRLTHRPPLHPAIIPGTHNRVHGTNSSGKGGGWACRLTFSFIKKQEFRNVCSCITKMAQSLLTHPQ
jgi:hypothetical protein